MNSRTNCIYLLTVVLYTGIALQSAAGQTKPSAAAAPGGQTDSGYNKPTQNILDVMRALPLPLENSGDQPHCGRNPAYVQRELYCHRLRECRLRFCAWPACGSSRKTAPVTTRPADTESCLACGTLTWCGLQIAPRRTSRCLRERVPAIQHGRRTESDSRSSIWPPMRWSFGLWRPAAERLGRFRVSV